MEELVPTKRIVAILSDIEMSTGDQYDDFPHTQFLCDFISRFNDSPYLDVEVDLVFNGDTFDFLKIPIEQQTPHLIDDEIALKKLKAVHNAHHLFFAAIDTFLSHGQRSRRVHFIAGNHDPEVLFPKVQSEIVSLCGGSGQIFFPGLQLKIGDLHIEHGNQHDSLFKFDPQNTFINHQGKKYLNLPWATVTLLNVMMPHRSDFYELDRIKPRELSLEMIPNLKEFILSTLWSYWTKDFLKDYMRTNDPLKKISWGMLKETMRRSVFFNPDVEINRFFYDQIVHHEDVKVYVIGHMHNPFIRSYGNRKVIQSGCFRDEFMLESDRESFTPIPKTYVEVELMNNLVTKSNLIEITPPEESYKRIPKGLQSYIEVIDKKLGTAEQRLKDKLEIEAQEEKEEKDPVD